jgi:acyl-CoA dehydrogenase
MAGREVIGMRVTWDKRYITLGPICTLLGLAFRLHDPDHLLGDKVDLGITCALVPTDHPGVNIGRRHFPLNAVFQNGPNSGKDVFMPLDWIIGGPAMAGQGWRMLMECLAAGRSISLPSSNTGMSKLAVRATGAYARVRSQFKTAIGRFEGIEEPLARMGGNLYMMDAARTMTAGAIDLGEKPSVVSAIVKYHVTERTRQVVNDAMDILGGKGICLGPNNFMGRAYQQIPVAITVEGANILTRSLIIFGQGAIRCHPYVLKEMAAPGKPTRQRACAISTPPCPPTSGSSGPAVSAPGAWASPVPTSRRCRPRSRRKRGATTSSCRASRRPSPSSPTSPCSSWAATSSARKSSRRAWATSSR